MPASAARAPRRPKKRSPNMSGEVDDVRPGKDLAQRQHLDELLARQPALALDQLALGDREDAAESLQREAVEGEEEVAGRCRLRARALVALAGVAAVAALGSSLIAPCADAPGRPRR